MAIKWNRIKDGEDLVEEYQRSYLLNFNRCIKRYPYSVNGSIDEKTVQMNIFFEMALLENKSGFVSLFLKNGFSLKTFLGEGRLKTLYNNEAVINFFYL